MQAGAAAAGTGPAAGTNSRSHSYFTCMGINNQKSSELVRFSRFVEHVLDDARNNNKQSMK